MRRLGVAAFCALLLVPAAGAAPNSKLTQERATAIFLANPKVASWLRHFPPKTRTAEATFSAQYGSWTIKVWTFRGHRGHLAYQGMRFLVVSTLSLAANLVILSALVALDVGKLRAQAIAIVLVTPLNFVGNKLWSFRR